MQKTTTIIISTPQIIFISSVYTSKLKMCVFQINVYCKRRDNSCDTLSMLWWARGRGRGWETRTVSETSRNLDSSWQEVQKQSLQCWMDRLQPCDLPPSSHCHFFLQHSVHFSWAATATYTLPPHAQVRGPTLPGWGRGRMRCFWTGTWIQDSPKT